MTDYARVAAAVPPLSLGDVPRNVAATRELAEQAEAAGAQVVVFPELGLTGYTLGDLLHQDRLIRAAAAGLAELARATRALAAVVVVGLPVRLGGKLYDCGAVVQGGRVRGVVPKTYLPNYGEFYDERWFASGAGVVGQAVDLAGTSVPMGTDLLFRVAGWPELVLGVEVCEDLWAPVPPSSWQTLAGATVIANLSASNELVGKAAYRRQLAAQQSARGRCGYVYAMAGVGESSTDVVFGGRSVIAENGLVVAEMAGFGRQPELIMGDIDLQHLQADRERATTFVAPPGGLPAFRTVELVLGPTAGQKPVAPRLPLRPVARHPFVPQDAATRAEHTAEVLQVQAAGLASRLERAGVREMLVGLSGGLDSTLALLVMQRAATMLGWGPERLRAVSLPGPATSHRTHRNAQLLAQGLGVARAEIAITPGVQQQLADIGHDGATQDVTYENAQARYRTMTLMNQANQRHGLVVGTGDLSELALGWSTFSGDQIAHYNVNAGVPKTLVRHVIAYAAELPEFAAVRVVLGDILATPISPELTNAQAGELSQATEELIGPYELHDFFLYHLVRWGSGPRKIRELATQAFAGTYSETEIGRWLKLFVGRFFGNQWKRSVMPDGPKVGSVALSPRGDWRMPSDAVAAVWLAELEG